MLFWVGMLISFTVAFFAAYPVNAFLLSRGKGHALMHGYHGAEAAGGARRLIPSFSTGGMVAALVAFLLGGLVVSISDETGFGASGPDGSGGGHAAVAPHGSTDVGDPGGGWRTT
ncbi:DUF4396 domain-containing protein [Nocardioides sambongensis]|uniref:DUF4396 domain-containing protein n=1 Tax=Nocardioides sambongensis TaxID=2589074 RepID=UPI0022AB6178|nr:DUF4396 domain-containing protein [Nocardioides sambongensis]